jgi:hypothetical protein
MTLREFATLDVTLTCNALCFVKKKKCNALCINYNYVEDLFN